MSPCKPTPETHSAGRNSLLEPSKEAMICGSIKENFSN
jgi:hypothetical protein